VGVFYYAGHGAQVGGRNYLIPLGARITSEAAVPYQAVAAEEVLARMESAGQGKALTVLILDACRNAPFMRGWRSPLRGLAPMQATGGSLIAYAAAPGAVAADGTGRNGTYTRHLLRFMTEPNLPVELMFKQVRLAVEQETKGQQIPWELSSLRENFAFHPGTGGPTSTSVVPTPAVVTPPAPQSSPSGGTQVAVGTYPQAPAVPKTQRNSLGMEFVLIHDTYACRRGKGVHAAVRRAQTFARRLPYVLQGDVRHYFETVDHAVLKALLRRKLKDQRLLALLDHIIDHPLPGGLPGTGLPIGNLTSQYFANLYLGELDHLVKEGLRLKGYVRYMDDILVFADTKAHLHATLASMRNFLHDTLRLTLKEEVVRIAAVTHSVSPNLSEGNWVTS
jgi:hypothetical protein